MADSINGNKAQTVRDYIAAHPRTSNTRVAQALAEIEVTALDV